MGARGRDVSPDSTVLRGAGADDDTVAILHVHVTPRTSRNEIVGLMGETLKVKLTAAPTGGKANEALVKLLAKTLGVRRSQVEIVSGHRARRKIVRIRGLHRDAPLAQIDQLRGGSK